MRCEMTIQFSFRVQHKTLIHLVDSCGCLYTHNAHWWCCWWDCDSSEYEYIHKILKQEGKGYPCKFTINRLNWHRESIDVEPMESIKFDKIILTFFQLESVTKQISSIRRSEQISMRELGEILCDQMDWKINVPYPEREGHPMIWSLSVASCWPSSYQSSLIWESQSRELV